MSGVEKAKEFASFLKSVKRGCKDSEASKFVAKIAAERFPATLNVSEMCLGTCAEENLREADSNTKKIYDILLPHVQETTLATYSQNTQLVVYTPKS